MGDAVLVLTAADDPTADAVITELDARGARVARLDTGDFPTRLRLSARNPVDGSDGWTGHLRADNGATVDLTEVGSVYYRRPTRFRFPGGMSDGDAVLAAAEARHGFGGVIASLDAMWINNPVNAAAEYKPLQLQVAARVGLTVPRTLITNSHEELAAFAEEIGGPVVCKAFSAVMLEDADGLKITYTTPVDPAEIDPTHELEGAPHPLSAGLPARPPRRR